MTLSREIIVLRHGQTASVAVADLHWHRLCGDLVEILTDPLPLDLAIVMAEILARDRHPLMTTADTSRHRP